MNHWQHLYRWSGTHRRRHYWRQAPWSGQRAGAGTRAGPKPLPAEADTPCLGRM